MASIYTFKNYKKWLSDRISRLPRKGRGELSRIARHLSCSPTIITQVFNGDRELTAEQAVLLCEYFSLSEHESRFFLLLVNHARAGSMLYRKKLEQQIQEMCEAGKSIKTRVPRNVELTEEVKAVLYSNWYYLAIWSLTAIPGFNDIVVLAQQLNLSKAKVRRAVDFLLQHGLVVEDSAGQLRMGPTLLHLERESPQLARHHQNWRLLAFRRYEEPLADDIFYTAPVTLSKKDAAVLHERILSFISGSVALIKDSPSEELYSLCLDWFKVLS